MFKKVLLVCVLTLSIFQLTLSAAGSRNLKQLDVAQSLQPLLKKILQIPDASALVESIQKEGYIHITTVNHPLSNQFGAFWDLEDRTICVNPRNSEGEQIGSILFELQNAAVNSQLEHLDNLASKGQIDRESYIRGVEYLEYGNSIKAAKIARQGIEMGLFPADAQLFTYRNFEEHYRYQKIGGHSAMISKNYDLLAPRNMLRS